MKFIITFLFITISYLSMAQPTQIARKRLDTLASKTFWGRGYTNDGMKKAAIYLQNEFKTLGLIPLNKKNKYFQEFSHPINTFPGAMELTINGKKLIPGKDFIVTPNAKSIKGSGTFEQLDSITYGDKSIGFFIQLKSKLTMSLTNEVAEYTLLDVDKNAIEKTPLSFEVNIENEFIKKFKANNICGFIKGTTYPDSFLVVSAHYDHLGGLGSQTYFPGANDNASGVTFLLGLVDYFCKKQSKFSIAFICFAGEEAGLIGSKYFTDNPLIPLKNIKFLLNTDLAGTGEDGITVVNGSEFTKEFNLLKNINDENKYLAAVNIRGKAANSDHYYFSEKGVPSFFFYTLGGIKAYHDVFDKPETLPMNEYADLQSLMIKFLESF